MVKKILSLKLITIVILYSILTMLPIINSHCLCSNLKDIKTTISVIKNVIVMHESHIPSVQVVSTIDTLLYKIKEQSISYELAKYYYCVEGNIYKYNRTSVLSHPNWYLGSINDLWVNYPHTRKLIHNYSLISNVDCLGNNYPQLLSDYVYLYDSSDKVQLGLSDLSLNSYGLEIVSKQLPGDVEYYLEREAKCKNYMALNRYNYNNVILKLVEDRKN